MHVIPLLPLLTPEANGLVEAVRGLCEKMSHLPIAIDLVALQVGDNDNTSLLPKEPIRTRVVRSRLALGASPLWAPGLLQALNATALNGRQSIIHSNGCWLPTNAAAKQMRVQRNIKLIVSPHGMLEPWALRNSRAKKQLIWRLFQRQELVRADVLHATSTAEAENLRRLGLHQPISVIPNGVELPPYLCNHARHKVKAKRTLFFLSRIHPKKGLLNLVAALQQLDLTDWRIIIAGPNENGHQREIEVAIAAAKLQKSITFVGPLNTEQKWTWYKRADLFVLPTFSENFGIVVAEALAAGVPVITTKGAPWQELETHHCGWWIDIGVEPLAQALRNAMNLTDEERMRMGENGRKLVEEKYSWTDVAHQMAEVYRWMLGQGPKPDCVWD